MLNDFSIMPETLPLFFFPKLLVEAICKESIAWQLRTEAERLWYRDFSAEYEWYLLLLLGTKKVPLAIRVQPFDTTCGSVFLRSYGQRVDQGSEQSGQMSTLRLAFF